MTKSFLIKLFILFLIPLYLFGKPLLEYINQSGQIIYSLVIPKQPSKKTDTDNLESVGNIDMSKIPISERLISQSWIIIFSYNNIDEENQKIKKQLKNLGFKTSVRYNKKKKFITIGPYVDKLMALQIKAKIKRTLNIQGKLIEVKK
tara:strand:- start:621 stop:1061 length:441 start_codon:yes stop_codon:yes gene_type:complete